MSQLQLQHAARRSDLQLEHLPQGQQRGDRRGAERADLAAAQLSGGRRWLAGGHGACQGAHGRGRHPELYGEKWIIMDQQVYIV